MCNNLTGLPFELSNIIVNQLDDADIRSLRFTSSALYKKTLHRFQQAITLRRIDLSSESLRGLVSVCENEDLSSAIQSITIVAKYYDTAFLQKVLDTNKMHKEEKMMVDPDKELAQMRADHSELKSREADQINLAANQSDLMFLSTAFRKSSKLRTISLEAVLYQYPEKPVAADKARGVWAQVWKRSLHVYLVTMTAIAQSQLAIEQLHIYSGPWGCSVPAYDIHLSMLTLKAEGLQESLKNLRILSLNYATRLIDFDQPIRPVALDKENFLGPAHFLSLCPGLEELYLKHYNLLPPESSSWAEKGLYWSNYENVFDHIAQAVRLPKLVKCKIRGLKLRQNALLQFLKDSPLLETLELRFVTLVDGGEWQPIINQCSCLQELTMQRLLQGQRWVSFGDNRQHGYSVLICNITLQKGQLKSGITFYLSPNFPPGICESISPWAHGSRVE